MLKTISKTLSFIAAVTVAGAALAAKPEPWITDMDQAQKTAKAEGKDILVYFTGSDWCAWCKILDKEVLSQTAFIDYAKENLVLVELDFPSDEELLTEEQLEHNEEWRDVFEPQGYPSIYLTDHNAKSYAITGYEEGGAEKYVANLKSLREGSKASAKLKAAANNASGIERARLLDKLLSTRGAIVDDRASKIIEIAEIAKGVDDALFNKYNAMVIGQKIGQDMKAIGRDASNEERLEKTLAVFNKYKHIKQGPALERLLANLGDSFIGADKGSDGVNFMETVVADSSYSMGMRQSAALFKGIINDNTTGGEQQATLNYLDATISMDPESSQGLRAKGIKSEMLESNAQ